jgi:DNA repair exonuclease SbcCD ATPase subunit
VTWRSLTRESIAATQVAVNQLVGVSRTTLHASTLLMQGEAGAWCDAGAAERMDVLAEILDLDHWHAYEARAKRDRDEKRGALDASTATVARLEEELAEHATIAAQKARAEDALYAAQDSLTSAETALQWAEQDLQHGREAKAKRDTLVVVARQAHAALEAGKQEGERERVRVEAEITRTEAQHRDTLKRIDTLAMQMERLKASIREKRDRDDATCQACGQPIHGEAKEMAIEALYDRLSDAMHDHDHAREGSMRLADEARHARARLAALPTDHTPDPDLQRAFDEARAAVQAVEKVNVEALEMTRFNAQAVVNGARDQVDALGRDIARLEERLARLDLVAEQVQAEREGQARLQGELDEVVVLCDAYHRDGIPSLIVENQALPVIEAEANRILAALATSFRVELHTTTETKAGREVPALDIVVCGPTGRREYASYSGGEKARVAIALRLGLARLLAGRRGAEIGLLVIDEIEGLDAAGAEALTRVLEELACSHRSVILVSHHAELRDRFSNVIEITGGADTGEPSRIVNTNVEVVA